MRYLYGDSAPFPYGFDFLATLDRFLEEAAKVVRADTLIHELVAKADAISTARARELTELDGLHATVLRALEEGGMRLGGDLAPEYAGRVIEAAGRAIDDARRAATSRTEIDRETLGREIDRHHEDVRAALEAFFVLARLPILAATLHMELVDGRAEMSADLLHPEGIVASLALAADRMPEWQTPRRAGEFVPELEMMVGVKRGLFSREERLEPMLLDDYVLGGFELAEEHARFRLRKRPADPDAYLFDAHMEEGRMVAQVTRPLEAGDGALPMPLEDADRQKVLTFWERLRRAVEGPLDRRERLIALLLDRDDVFESGRAMDLVERLVRALAHTVAEIAKRSPHKEELSLKRETQVGQREELYLRKRDLAARLASLSVDERAVFAPLAIFAAPGDG